MSLNCCGVLWFSCESFVEIGLKNLYVCTFALCESEFNSCIKSNQQNMSLRKDFAKIAFPLFQFPLDLMEHCDRADLRTSVGFRKLMKYEHLNDQFY